MPRLAPLLALLVGLCLAPIVQAAKPIRPGDAARLTAARQALDNALQTLRAEPADAPPSPAGAAAADALKTIEALVDSYHHAPNLRAPSTRAHALALRPVVGRLFAPDGPLVLVDDVIHPRPAVARALADAAKRAGNTDGHIRWLRAALASAPNDRPLLIALRDGLLAAGDLKGANAVALRLEADRGGAISAPKHP